SIRRGEGGWNQNSEPWFPPLIATADQLDQYGDNFLQQQILGHIENGRVYGEVHPHRSDFGGTRSFRFSYSHPPLQQMPKHDEELAPLIRSVFLPEEGETWASCDFCHDDQTEILTEHGWIPFPELGDDRVAQWDRGHINFVTPTHKFVGEAHARKMVHVHSRRGLDFCVTENHRCLLLKR